MKRQHYPCNVLGFRCSGIGHDMLTITSNNVTDGVDLLRIHSRSKLHGILPMPYLPGAKIAPCSCRSITCDNPTSFRTAAAAAVIGLVSGWGW
jgi:hypothetical protein